MAEFRPDVDELAATIAAEMWMDGWTGTRTIDRDQVLAAYGSSVPEYVAEQALEQLIDDGVVRDDFEGLHGWPPTRVALVNSPDAIREYIQARTPRRVPWDLREE